MKLEKNKHIFDVCLTKFEKYHFLLNKISHIFIVTTKQFGG
jgi:hypothetical protein